MLKQKRQIFELLFVACDLAVVSIAWILAYWARFEAEFIPVDKGVPPVSNYLSMILFIWLIWVFVFRRMGLYRPMRGVRRIREVWLLVNANILALVLFIAATFLFREKSAPFSRLVFLYFGVISIVLTILERSILRFCLREVRRRGYNLRYMLMIGAGKVAADIVSRVRLHREIGIQLVGCLSKDGTEKKGPGGLPVIGKYLDVKKMLSQMEIDQIVVVLPLEDNGMITEIMQELQDTLVDVRIVPDLYQFVSLGGYIEEFEGLPVINLRGSPLEGINLVAKRTFDLALAGALLILLLPFMIIVALIVKLTSRGPIFYRQERVSYDGSPFNIYKFRTMYIDAETSGPRWSTKDDKRVTPLGKWLRRYSLDELPQLFNVMRGDMSIVGPRPERPVFIEEFRRYIPRYILRHKVPAGMTGWAQVNGWRGDTAIDKRIEHDLYYIENWSLFLDFKILFLTLFRGIRDRSV